jgi:Raf kinase inhibitor-like YbhB/YbcL family protein
MGQAIMWSHHCTARLARAARSALLVLLAAECGRAREGARTDTSDTAARTASAGGGSMAVSVSSSAFREGERIPAKYTCDGAGVSPPLALGDAPSGTASWALIMDDPDAPRGTWVHWVAYDIAPGTRELPEALPTSDTLPQLGSARQGQNSSKKTGYGGPCPPPGHGPHHYVFKVYALDRALGLAPGATKADVERAMAGHILGEARLTGTYERR